jgi:hypothetical protein
VAAVREWLECTDPVPMLQLLRGRAGDRKLLLFACACCRRAWNQLTDLRSRRAVEAAERYADGEVSAQELAGAVGAARHAYENAFLTHDNAAYAVVCLGAEKYHAAELASAYTAYATGHRHAGVRSPALIHDVYTNGQADERRLQADLLRDIFGNPFRTVRLEAAWLAWNGGVVPRLAEAIYNERRFADLPVLGDALEEAGCADPDVLSHCRCAGPHVPGCWVLDLLLGRP